MSGKIWVVVQHRDGKLHRGSKEAIAAAQSLGSEIGRGVEALILGNAPDGMAAELGKLELETVRVLEHPLLAEYTPGGYVAALAPLVAAQRPAFILLPHTYQSVDYSARLAQTCDAALLPEAIGFLRVDGELQWKRPVLGGKLHARVRVKGEGTVVVSLQSGAFSADAIRAGNAALVKEGVTLGETELQREVLGFERASTDQIDLTKAEIIVAVGRGVGGPEKLGPVEELAKLLGGEIAASRPVIDSGWLPRDRQVGSSGQTVAPKLYLALGISGAIQHLVGMKGAAVVAAVNKDATAPIFKIATYGCVGDLHEVVPALAQALRERAG